ncbi:MAG: hypothetical protein DMG39_28320 [Acidobacteria bacterium]|nr:MAG: hypothetical protein DMG39_28320 [Acidobacteriota bacterium]
MLGKGPHRVAWNNRFTGREEKRLPFQIAVKLAPAESASAERVEKAYVANISGRGACVYAHQPWQPGEQVAITPPVREVPLRGEVIYCQKLEDGRFVVGLKFQRNPQLASIMQEWKRQTG